ncbi:hypothetical protein RF641_01575 [Arthrobacter sp. LS16]|uniref:hypothetical protein n=1 Tax=Arthrobacter sp. 'calajunan' TaxID=1690248 RepID=UPI003C7746C4
MKVKPVLSPLGEFHLEFVRDIYGRPENYGPKFIAHGHPRQLTGDRIAVASILLVGNAIAHTLDVGRDVSSRVASAINLFLNEQFVSISNVVKSPPAYLSGGVELVLQSDLSRLDSVEDKMGRKRLLFVDLPTDKFAGRLMDFEAIQMASNSYLFSSEVCAGNPVPRLWSRLALAIIFASDLSVSRISLPEDLCGDITATELSRLVELLQSIEINLVVGEV